MIVYLQSGECNNYFPTKKKTWHFKIHLKTPLIFDGKWKVALLEFKASASKTKSKNNTNQTLFIFSNICDESILNGEKNPVLRRVSPYKSNQWDTRFERPIYLTIKKKELLEILFEIYIKDLNNGDASFLQEPVLVTLQFVIEI